MKIFHKEMWTNTLPSRDDTETEQEAEHPPILPVHHSVKASGQQHGWRRRRQEKSTVELRTNYDGLDITFSKYCNKCPCFVLMALAEQEIPWNAISQISENSLSPPPPPVMCCDRDTIVRDWEEILFSLFDEKIDFQKVSPVVIEHFVGDEVSSFRTTTDGKELNIFQDTIVKKKWSTNKFVVLTLTKTFITVQMKFEDSQEK